MSATMQHDIDKILRTSQYALIQPTFLQVPFEQTGARQRGSQVRLHSTFAYTIIVVVVCLATSSVMLAVWVTM
jgi:hypothetical protein